MGEYQIIEFRGIKQRAVSTHNFISKCMYQAQLNPRIEVQIRRTVNRRLIEQDCLQSVEIGRFASIGGVDPIRKVLGDQRNGRLAFFSLLYFVIFFYDEKYVEGVWGVGSDVGKSMICPCARRCVWKSVQELSLLENLKCRTCPRLSDPDGARLDQFCQRPCLEVEIPRREPSLPAAHKL